MSKKSVRVHASTKEKVKLLGNINKKVTNHTPPGFRKLYSLPKLSGSNTY